ncbi:hypothetical protein TWF281_011174 [Arthrobotrys megalospora]
MVSISGYPLLHETLTDDEIVDYYEAHTLTPPTSSPNLRNKPPSSITTSSTNFRNGRLVHLPPSAIIKSGLYVYDEALNLLAVSRILYKSVVRVPTVYRMFEKDGVGYLVMEYIPGRQLNLEDTEEVNWLVEKVVGIVEYFWGIKNCVPGAVGGGVCRGYWWSSDFPRFEGVEGLEEWVNRRLLNGEKVWKLEDREMVLCHLDLVSRNILIVDEDGEKNVAVVDWESAGWFPKIFEIARLEAVVSNGGREVKFERKLLKRLVEMLGDEGRDLELVEGIRRAWEGVQG